MEEKLCIICGSKAKYDLCYSCFTEKNKIKTDLEGSTNTLEDTKDYYNNLKYNIFKLKRMDYAKTACLKLLSIGEVLEQQYKQKGYIEKSKKDAEDLLLKKKAYLESLKNKNEGVVEEQVQQQPDDRSILIQEEQLGSDEILDYRRVYPMTYRCKDGHYVRSKAERIIDDSLFEAQILHVYEKRVVNEDNEEEYYPDFYLPFEGKTFGKEKGIYIEFFGLEDNEKYMKTELKKLAYYKSKGYDVIEVRDKNISCIDEYLEDEIRKINKKHNN